MPGTIIADSHSSHFSCSYSQGQCIHKSICLYEREREMYLVQVNSIYPQALQTRIKRSHQSTRREPIGQRGKLAGDNNRATIFASTFAQNTLRLAPAVHFRCIEKIETNIKASLIRLPDVLLCMRRAIAPETCIAPTPDTYSHRWDGYSCRAKLSGIYLNHGVSFVRYMCFTYKVDWHIAALVAVDALERIHCDERSNVASLYIVAQASPPDHQTTMLSTRWTLSLLITSHTRTARKQSLPGTAPGPPMSAPTVDRYRQHQHAPLLL